MLSCPLGALHSLPPIGCLSFPSHNQRESEPARLKNVPIFVRFPHRSSSSVFLLSSPEGFRLMTIPEALVFPLPGPTTQNFSSPAPFSLRILVWLHTFLCVSTTVDYPFLSARASSATTRCCAISTSSKIKRYHLHWSYLPPLAVLLASDNLVVHSVPHLASLFSVAPRDNDSPSKCTDA